MFKLKCPETAGSLKPIPTGKARCLSPFAHAVEELPPPVVRHVFVKNGNKTTPGEAVTANRDAAYLGFG